MGAHDMADSEDSKVSEDLISLAMRRVHLPDKQRRVVSLVARGYTTPQIAEMLGIRPATVAAHRRAALLRLGLRSAVGLTHVAIQEGWVRVMEIPGETKEGD
jgi:DNA-binding NarL/FixJ family response regulator